MEIWTDLSTVLSQFTRVTDRRTDRILIARARLHSMQRGKKTNTSSAEQHIKNSEDTGKDPVLQNIIIRPQNWFGHIL